MDQTRMTIGQLARASGVSVRTLRHYDQIGLLTPQARTLAGYRLYCHDDIERLQHIRLLKALTWPLRDIADLLNRRPPVLAATLNWQLEAIDSRVAQLQQVRATIQTLIRSVETGGQVSTTEFLTQLKEMTQMEKHYSPEQLETLASRRAELGEAGMAKAERQWADLIERARAAREAGLQPDSDELRMIASEWKSLVSAFTGGDSGIQANLQSVWQAEDEIHGFDTQEIRSLMEYVSRAM